MTTSEANLISLNNNDNNNNNNNNNNNDKNNTFIHTERDFTKSYVI